MTRSNHHSKNALRSALFLLVMIFSTDISALVDCELDADFEYTTFNHTVFFSEISSNLNAGSVTNWYWQFGDGNTSMSPEPIYAYSGYGTFMCCLTVTTLEIDGTECVSTMCKEVVLAQSAPCLVQSNFDHESMDNGKVQFLQTCEVNKYTSISSYNWGFGDGSFSTEANPLHQFETTGHYTVCLLVTGVKDDISCSNEYCLDVPVDKFLCEVSPEIQVRHQTGCGINFVNYSEAINFTSIVAYSWDFGDASYSSETSPIHYYSENGEYEVCLTVLAECPGNFCEIQYCLSVEVECNDDPFHQQNSADRTNLETSVQKLPTKAVQLVSAKLYPNPTSGKLYLQADKELTYNVFTSLGVLVQRGLLFEGVNQLDLEGLTKGIYLVEYTDGITSDMQRVVLN